MERVSIGWVSITQGKVNCNAKLDFTAAKNVLKESVALVEDETFEANALITTTPNNIVLYSSFS